MATLTLRNLFNRGSGGGSSVANRPVSPQTPDSSKVYGNNTGANSFSTGAVSPVQSYYSEAQELANAQKLSDLYANAINTRYSAGIANLQDQMAHISEDYEPYRLQAEAAAIKSHGKLQENMANLGLTRSGTNLTMQTGIETAKQRTLADINAQEAKAARDLQAQINEYIAQRDSAIATQTADLYQSAYGNVSSFNRNMQTMATQHGYDKEMAAIEQSYNKEMAAIEQQYKLAYMRADYQEQAQLQREMAEIEQRYNMQLKAYDSQLAQQEYNNRAATDWSYYQKQAALDSQNDINLYNAKALYNSAGAASTSGSAKSASSSAKSTSSSGNPNSSTKSYAPENSGSKVASSHDLKSQTAKTLYDNIEATRTSSNPANRKAISYNYIDTQLDTAYDTGKITYNEYMFLLDVMDNTRF